MRVVKLSEYAEMCEVTYRTGWNRFKVGSVVNDNRAKLSNV